MYVPPVNLDAILRNSRIENILVKVVKGAEKIEYCLMENRADILGNVSKG